MRADAPPIAYAASHVRRLTGLSRHQLSYWEQTGFVPLHDCYSFHDLLALTLLARLRNVHGIPLQSLRKVGRWLAERRADPWAELRVAVEGRRVLVGEADESSLVLPHPGANGQTSFAPPGATIIDPSALAADVTAAALSLAEPPAMPGVARARQLLSNAPRVAGTRVPTAALWRLHLAGHDEASIALHYPRLRAEDIAFALAFERDRRRT